MCILVHIDVFAFLKRKIKILRWEPRAFYSSITLFYYILFYFYSSILLFYYILFFFKYMAHISLWGATAATFNEKIASEACNSHQESHTHLYLDWTKYRRGIPEEECRHSGFEACAFLQNDTKKVSNLLSSLNQTHYVKGDSSGALVVVIAWFRVREKSIRLRTLEFSATRCSTCGAIRQRGRRRLARWRQKKQ